MADHSKRAHAILSASGSERWLNCSPSARLEDEFGVKTTSVFAEEGTVAHELGELMLQLEVTETISENTYIERLADIMSKPQYNDDMLIEVPKYVDYCRDQITAARIETPDAIILIEQKIDLTAYIPEGFGLCDTIIISDGTMEVIDLKYGKGVAVSAVANKQLMVYALGALEKYSMAYDIQTVKVTIAQPRLNNISSWSIPADELIKWGEDELLPKATLAFQGGGILRPGSWCKFCSVKHRCTALASENLAVAKFDFAKPEFLSDEEIASILIKVPMLVDWANGLAEYALNMAITKNKVWPGFKLVEGVSRRKWADDVAAVKLLRANFPGCEDEDIFNTSLKSITDIEKLVTKKRFAEIMAPVVIKPQGKPSLVLLSDKRPALGIEQAKADFS